MSFGTLGLSLASPIGDPLMHPALNLDFRTGTMDSRITFARADATTCATRVNASGLIETVAANVPRFDYDPVTLAIRGLLIEETRQNKLLNSAALSTQSVTVTAVAHTLSFYGTGSVVLSGTATATVSGSGAYPTRTTYTFTPTDGTLTLTVTGTVQYANLEIGSFATSWISTAGSPATRAVDNASMTGTNFSSWYVQGQGTFFVDQLNVQGSFPTLLHVSDGSAVNFNIAAYIFKSSASATPSSAFQYRTYVNNVATNAVSGSASPNGKIGMTHAASGILIAEHNNSILSGAGNGIPATNQTQMMIGYDPFNSGRAINGTISYLSYYPIALSATQLKSTTS